MTAKKTLRKVIFAFLILVVGVAACAGSEWNDGVIGTTTPPPSALTSTPTPAEALPPISDLVPAQVTKVVDGDTIEVLIDGVEYRLRYIGIDTPETRHPTRGVEPFGPEASQANQELVDGKRVWLEKDVSETDQYGRLLRYVYVGDLMVNEELLRRGLARVATFPPDVKYVNRFLAIQREAREAGLGLWGSELNGEGPSSVPPIVTWGYTYQRPDGNRLVPGKGRVPYAAPLDIQLDAQPDWLVGAATNQGSIWVAVLADGRVQAFQVVGREVRPMPVTPTRVPPGMPPLLKVKDSLPNLITNPTPGASTFTHPVALSDPEEMLAFIEAGGDLVIWDTSETARLSLAALTDARILMDEAGRLLLLTDATTRYNHGVLGDSVEAAGITLVETDSQAHIAQKMVFAPPSVVEGSAPIWSDLTGDGVRDIVVTLSDAEQGAKVIVLSESGEQIASGPAIGRGFRWRHQLVVAPFGPDDELELADVLTPHIGGVVEFYQLAGDRLEIVAQVPGYSSHVIGSRNLDAAVAGDLDGDGRIELLVPNQARTSLGAIRRKPGGAGVVWEVSANDRISTNLAAVSFPDGTLAVGVGHQGHQVRLWLP